MSEDGGVPGQVVAQGLCHLQRKATELASSEGLAASVQVTFCSLAAVHCMSTHKFFIHALVQEPWKKAVRLAFAAIPVCYA